MGDVLSPFTVSPPPPPSSSTSKNSIPMLYYGLVVVGTASVVLAIYNLVIIKRCNRRHTQETQSQPPAIRPNNRLVEVVVTSEGRSFDNSQRNYLLSSFKYKKEVPAPKEGSEGDQEQQQQDGGDGGNDSECPVCLSVYEEGEEVRKLPRCKHSFHALCIDMWLYSHFDCPICRTPVGPFCHPFPAESPR